MRIPHRRCVVACLFLLLALGASACGGSETTTDASVSDAETSAVSDDTTTEPAAEDAAEGDAATDDDAVADDPEPAVAAESGDFCGLFIENQDLLDDFDFFDPSEVEAWFNESARLLDQAVGVAPAEVAEDLGVLRSNYDLLLDALEENEYDFFAASAALEDLDTTEVDDASDRLDAYVESACGVDPDQASDDLAEDIIENDLGSLLDNPDAMNAVVEGMVAEGDFTQEQVTCMLTSLDPALLAGLAGGDTESLADPAVLQDLLGVLETCGIDITALSG
ncbi:MAG: hypothetical protein AAGC53_20185 [Actinomycetota bacterium]